MLKILERTTVYEFYGCYWHAFLKCMKNRHQLTADNDTKAADAHERTFNRAMELQSIGYNMIEMWECDLLQQLHSNPEMKTFLATVEIPELINPQEVWSVKQYG
uniref:Uncharacterized protein n=1 Tax=Romanomermis culicivorax TaxID=13658 RepID=A0A915L1T2_ROMCU